MSFEAWVGTISGILFIIGALFAFLYKVFRSGITEEIYKKIDEENAETYATHQQIRIDMALLIEKRIIETENIRERNITLMRKNDSDKLENINMQVSEMKLSTAKQLQEISVDLKLMSGNMNTLSNTLVEHKTRLGTLERTVDKDK